MPWLPSGLPQPGIGAPGPVATSAVHSNRRVH